MEWTVRSNKKHIVFLIANGYLYRQIRNAFQAAIALAEYEGQRAREGGPRPTLGEAQFNIVAESSREFDKYLVSTLGAAESDIARREEWRSDRFGNPEPKKSTTSKDYDRMKPGFYGGNRNETEEDDDETSSDDDEDSNDDDDDDDDDDIKNEDITSQRRSNKKARGIVKDDAIEQDEAEEFREFLKWKRAQKSGKGH